MSTCIRKWTPPRRSRPRYIGSACTAVSHVGERDSRFSATMYAGSRGSGLSARWIASLAFICASVSTEARAHGRIEADGVEEHAAGFELLSLRIFSMRGEQRGVDLDRRLAAPKPAPPALRRRNWAACRPARQQGDGDGRCISRGRSGSSVFALTYAPRSGAVRCARPSQRAGLRAAGRPTRMQLQGWGVESRRTTRLGVRNG